MVDAFLTPAEATSIKADFASLFATSKLLGNTVNLVLWRDSETDGTAVAVPAQSILVVWASREASSRRGQATFFTGMEGELRKEAPFDVAKSDRFTLPDGVSGRVTTPPITTGAFIRVAFEVEA